jgi:hypothetical protein
MLAAAVAACAAAPATDPLETPVRAVWSGLPIRAWADRASRLAGLPIVVDRRLDPDVAVTGTAAGESLHTWLDRVAAAAGATAEPLAASVRLVPASRAGLAVRAEESRRLEIARLPPVRRAALAARRAWTWPAGARPRALVTAAVAETGGTPIGIDRVPHDHLPALSLEPLSLAERVDLVLAQYDLRMAWDSGPSGTVVPIDSGLAAAAPSPGRPWRAPARGPAPRAEPRFTLALEAPLEEAARAVAAQLGLAAHVDRESLRARGIQPGAIVRARTTDATRDQLLDAIVAPLGLRWRIDGDRLVIDAPP